MARSRRDRERVAQSLMSVHRMTWEDASDWCDRWELYAARSGLGPRSTYFWDAARGWIDAQLDHRSILRGRVGRYPISG